MVILKVVGMAVGTETTMSNSRTVAAVLLAEEDPHVLDQAA